MVGTEQKSISVFLSYSRQDKPLLDQLEIHLNRITEQGVLSLWYDRQIVAGSEWKKEIDRRMRSADIVLLLISPDFIASKYCYKIELPLAMELHEAGRTCVVPILLRPVADWQECSFAKLQIFPTGGTPITEWTNQDSAFVNVVGGIKGAVNELLRERDRNQQEQERREQEKLRREQERLRLEEAQRQQVEKTQREEQAENQRQELIRAEEARQSAAEKTRRAEKGARRWQEAQRIQEAQRAQEAKRAEDAKRAEADRQKEQARQSATRSQTSTSQPTGVDRERRKLLQWLGLGSAGMFVTGLSVQALRGGRSNLQPFDFEVATVNAKGQESPRQRKQSQMFVEDLVNGVTLEMVSIPSGTFQMGSPTTEKLRGADESPQHPVNVSAFLIGRYAVTTAQYKAVMGTTPWFFRGAKRPVERVSWNDAQEFCKKLSQKTGRTYRLPSEAEWEYACRAGTYTPFHFGETITSSLANYQATFTYQSEPEGHYRKQTTDVGTFPANAFGLCDMHGNVWEWCEDVYHKNYEGAPKDGSAWNLGGERDRRLLRSGSWDTVSAFCRSASRGGNAPDSRDNRVGFRVVCSSARA
jgi:formylglycine-generating enzyme required for sulfatase activity